MLSVTASVALIDNPARACGAVVSNDTSLVVQSHQRVFISSRSDGTSHVVVQLAIPAANAPFGALTPVAGQPTLDPEPVDVDELDELELSTRPSVRTYGSGSDSGGCGCGSSDAAGDGKGLGSGGGSGVNVVQIVDIGPVTAAALSADSAAPLTQWLTDNGFVIPTAQQSIVDAYVGPNKFFIAFKRNTQAASGASSVGVSFSVAGDQRGYPLRMSSIGADQKLGIQVFIAAPESVSPTGSAPEGAFSTLTLADLSPSALAEDYTQAVFDEVAQRSSKAFVVEGVYRVNTGWRANLGPKLTAITDLNQVLTRLTTVVDPKTLDQDVMLTGAAPDEVPTQIYALAIPMSGPGRGGDRHRELYLAAAGLSFAAWRFRRAVRVHANA